MTLPRALAMLIRRVIGAVAATGIAAALMTAAWAVPARADSRDLAKILAGIAAIALIAKAIDDDKDKDKDRRKRDRRPAVTQHDPDLPFVPGHRTLQDHRAPQAEARRIPADCALEVRGGGRSRLAYGEQCLVSYGLRRLPRHCAYDATIFGRADRLYPAACLREGGFRLPRR